MPGPASAGRALLTLRRFAGDRKPTPTAELCEFCGAALAEDHTHVVEPSERKLICACPDCETTSSASYRRIPKRVRYLANFRLSEDDWNSLLIPIGVAFFLNSSADGGGTTAFYPSPAGPIESAVPSASWERMAGANTPLREIEPDVEALLVNRIPSEPEYYVAPVDLCYRLTGLVRKHWRGLSGGTEAWLEMNRFFADLRRRSDA